MKTSNFFLTPVRVAALFAFALFTTVGAWAENINYVDANGASRSHEATILTGSDNSTTLAPGWYAVNSDVTYSGQLQFNLGEVNLILCDGATLTINSGSTNALQVEGNLTIYAQSGGSGALKTSTTSSGIHANSNGNITINGGNITTSSSNGPGISTIGDITINGGTVNAVNCVVGLRATHITLAWRNASDRINAKTYELEGSGSLSVAEGKFLTDANGHIYTGTLSASEKTAIANTALMGTHLLYDAASNVANIETLAGKLTNITLSGRKLYKDGKWNTLCLPFNMTISGSVLDGATVKKLTASESGVSGTTLTLYFEDEATTLTAGTPYIIKWAKANDYVDDDAHNLVNPTFSGVTVNNNTKNTDFNGGSFVGSYSPVNFMANDKTKLFLGAANKLYWPNANMTLGACRAYFNLSNTLAPDMNFVVNFGEDATSIGSLTPNPSPTGEGSEYWYDLSGRKLDHQPTQKGVYIHSGKKVVVK